MATLGLKSVFERYPKASPGYLLDQVENLAPRERNMVLIAAVCIVAFFFYFIVSAGSKKIKFQQGDMAARERLISEIQQQSGALREKNGQISEIRSRIRPGTGFYLASHVENEIRRFQIPVEKMSSETRTDVGGGIEEISVDVSLSRLGFPKMLNLLSDLENTSNAYLRVKRIRVKSVPNDSAAVDVDFKVSAYTQK